MTSEWWADVSTKTDLQGGWSARLGVEFTPTAWKGRARVRASFKVHSVINCEMMLANRLCGDAYCTFDFAVQVTGTCVCRSTAAPFLRKMLDNEICFSAILDDRK